MFWRGAEGCRGLVFCLRGWVFCVGREAPEVLRGGSQCAQRRAGAVRSDIRVPEAQRGRVPQEREAHRPLGHNIAGVSGDKARRKPQELRRASNTKSSQSQPRKSSTFRLCSSGQRQTKAHLSIILKRQIKRAAIHRPPSPHHHHTIMHA